MHNIVKYSYGGKICRQLRKQKCEAEDIEGITLHGGEPLDQAEGLLEIAKSLKTKSKIVILFTGYTYKELSLKSQRALWRISDIVVSGRYDESKSSTERYREGKS